MDSLISVIVPCHNYGRFLPDALQSLRDNSYPHWECVVVDDGSSDNTTEVVKEFSSRDERFVLLRQAQTGMVGCFNLAAAHVRGEIVTFLDADDLASSDRLYRIAETFERNPRSGLVTHRLSVVDADLHAVGLFPLGQLPEGDYEHELRGSTLGLPGIGVASSMALRRNIFDLIFPASVEARNFPDELIRRIAPLATHITSIDAALGLRRIHSTNLSSSVRGTDALIAQLEMAKACYEAIEREVQVKTGTGEPTTFRDMWVLFLDYVLARLGRAQDWRARARAFHESPDFKRLSVQRRVYWIAARCLPRPVFVRMVSSYISSSGLKPLLNFLTYFHRRRKIADLPPEYRPRLRILLAHLIRNSW